MAASDLSLTPAEKKYLFRKKFHKEFEEKLFFSGAMGTGDNVIEKITELTRNSKGEQAAYFPLIPRMTGGGIVNDNTIRGRERSVEAAWQKANYSLFANAVVNKGPASDQKSLIQLRNIYSPLLSSWLADSNEDQCILTASGISYAFNTDGSPRITPAGQDNWTQLDYAADVSAPTANRHLRWDATSGLLAGDTDAMDPADKIRYAMLPDIKAYAMNKRIPPVRVDGRDVHFLMVLPQVMASLWKDDDFRSSIVQGDNRGSDNALMRFGKTTVHDLVIVPYQRMYNTTGAASGTAKWGSGHDVDGSRCLLMGAQGIARVDLGPPEWLEQKDDYGRVTGFGIQHFGGWTKVAHPSSYDGGKTEDFGIVAVDVAI
jgi:hypothetical protein